MNPNDGTENIWCCSRQNLESSHDGSVGTRAVLDADWAVITKYRGVFDLMNIKELRLSVTATVGRILKAVMMGAWARELC